MNTMMEAATNWFLLSSTILGELIMQMFARYPLVKPNRVFMSK
jgi:hypothetical protein